MSRKLIIEIIGDASSLQESLNSAAKNTEEFGAKTRTLPMCSILAPGVTRRRAERRSRKRLVGPGVRLAGANQVVPRPPFLYALAGCAMTAVAVSAALAPLARSALQVRAWTVT